MPIRHSKGEVSDESQNKINRSFFRFSAPAYAVFTPLMAADKVDVVESETGFYYTIQKGDTLWDLSNHFNDSPWLWPELWEGNDQISNPHWIFPGERIRLYRKSGSQVNTQTDAIRPVAVIPPVEVAPVKPAEGKKAAVPFFMYMSIDGVGFIRKPPYHPREPSLRFKAERS
jgi:hypothetical protein